MQLLLAECQRNNVSEADTVRLSALLQSRHATQREAVSASLVDVFPELRRSPHGMVPPTVDSAILFNLLVSTKKTSEWEGGINFTARFVNANGDVALQDLVAVEHRPPGLRTAR